MYESIGYRWSLTGMLFLLILSTGLAQSIVPRFETIDVEDGLSQNSVYRIYQDKRGFMWFGTADGLNRYDGNHIKVFKVPGPRSRYARGKLKFYPGSAL